MFQKVANFSYNNKTCLFLCPKSMVELKINRKKSQFLGSSLEIIRTQKKRRIGFFLPMLNRLVKPQKLKCSLMVFHSNFDLKKGEPTTVTQG